MPLCQMRASISYLKRTRDFMSGSEVDVQGSLMTYAKVYFVLLVRIHDGGCK